MPGISNNYKVISQEYGDTVIETNPCMLCKKTTRVTLPDEKFWRWHNGENIQSVFPEMEAWERELIISGTHDDCWNTIFPDKFEED